MEMLAGEEGFEPSNAGIKIRCLNQLGDSPAVDRLRYEASEAQIIQDIKKKNREGRYNSAYEADCIVRKAFACGK